MPTHQSIAAACRALRASAEDRVLLLVDTVLQENGLADSSVSLFRACTLCFVDLPKLPSADAPTRASPPPASGGLVMPAHASLRSVSKAAKSCWQHCMPLTGPDAG